MEPITTAILASAIYNEVQVPKLIGGIIGGIVGNRADEILCNSTNKIYQKFKNTIGEPTNHDIQKSVRKSYLKATLVAVRKINKNYKRLDGITNNNNPEDIKNIHKYLKSELLLLDKDDVRFPIISASLEHQELLFPKEVTSIERLPEIISSLKENVFKELKNNKLRVELTLKKIIIEGWKDKAKEIDWYDLTCAFFTEELKTNPRLSTFIQTEYLDMINADLIGLKISIEDIKEKLEPRVKQYKRILKKTDKLLQYTISIKKTGEDTNKTLHKFKDNLGESLSEIKALLETSGLNYQVIELHLEKLKPYFKKSKKETKSKIKNWFKNGKISIEERDLLSLILRLFFKEIELRDEKIENLKIEGNKGIYKFLEKIQLHFKDLDSHKIKENYFSAKERLKKDNILILKESLKATTALFAHLDSIELFQELVVLEPTGDNYYQFAVYSYQLNFFKEALENFEKALEIYEPLYLKNAQDYTFKLAATLASLGDLLLNQGKAKKSYEYLDYSCKVYRDYDSDELPKEQLQNFALVIERLADLFEHYTENNSDLAIEYYEKALKIHVTLSNEATEIFSPSLASNLTHQAKIYSRNGDFNNALIKYDQALIYYYKFRDKKFETHGSHYLLGMWSAMKSVTVLFMDHSMKYHAIKNFIEANVIIDYLYEKFPKRYEQEYAQMLVLGCHHFDMDKEKLKMARSILEKYGELVTSKKLLAIIDSIEK